MDSNKYRKLYSREQIAQASQEIGAQITQWAAEVLKQTNQQVLTVPVLRGGLFFFADLVREVGCSVEIAPLSLQAYKKGQNVANDQLQMEFEPGIFKDRSVLLVDDICDSGRSLKVLTERIVSEGALEVRTAVLIHREQRPEIFTPDWVGMQYSGEEWFVGYGMDDCDFYRNSPDVYIIIRK